MGQQQLLLLVLGIVIVALAVVSGLFIFEENLKKSNAEALVSDAVDIAMSAQAWKTRPATFGGQRGFPRNNTMDFTGFTFSSISLEDPHVTPNGIFNYTADSRGLIITGTSDTHGNRITMTVAGLTEKDIIAVVSSLEDSEGETFVPTVH